MRLLYIVLLTLIAAIVTYYIVTAFVMQQQAINKQSIYVHLQPEWDSYPGSIVYDVTNVWSRTSEGPQIDQNTRISMAKSTNVEELHQMHNKSYILVQHDNTNCHDVWEPHYARFGADVVRHYFEYMSGIQKSPDPNINLYNPVEGKQNLAEHENELKTGYSQFIPVCTEKNATSYDYAVRINDHNVGFDVYFVPSISEQEKYDEGKDFEYYKSEGCSGKNYVLFSGTCSNVSKTAGLLIVVPDRLDLPLTKFDVWFYEK